MKTKITAIILAAGQGKRMNSSVAKQFITLQDKPIIYYSLKAFEESSVGEIILVTGKDMVDYCKENIVDFYKISKVSQVIEGGSERYDSVYKALLKACLVGTPVKETIKVVNAEGYIEATPDRNTLWAAQTPQAFEYLAIRAAYEELYKEIDIRSLGITDDAMVFETYRNFPVKMLHGDYNNIKITTPEDLILADKIMNQALFKN